MKWKDKIIKLKQEGRIPEEFYGLIISTAEQAVNEEKLRILKDLEDLLEKSKEEKDFINTRNLIPYHARLETIIEITDLITNK